MSCCVQQMLAPPADLKSSCAPDAGTQQGSMASSKAVAKPKEKQPRQKATAAPTTMKAAPPKDTVLQPARLQADGAELAQSVPSLRAELTEAFRQALETAYPSANIEPVVAQTNEPKFGDYQCNNAMALFGQLKGKVRNLAKHLSCGAWQCILANGCSMCSLWCALMRPSAVLLLLLLHHVTCPSAILLLLAPHLLSVGILTTCGIILCSQMRQRTLEQLPKQ